MSRNIIADTVTNDMSLEPSSEIYILPDSNKKLYEINDLRVLTADQLALARNEIYARYGYIFKTQKYADYFSAQSWYKPNPNYTVDDSVLNSFEKENITLIQQLENGAENNTEWVQDELTVQEATNLINVYFEKKYPDSGIIVTEFDAFTRSSSQVSFILRTTKGNSANQMILGAPDVIINLVTGDVELSDNMGGYFTSTKFNVLP